MLTLDEALTAIAEHSEGLATAASGHLDSPVTSCPGWSMADLVWHLTEVQWFWATIAEELLSEPPDETLKPPRGSNDALIADLRLATQRLVRVLGSADQSTAVWTWAPTHMDIAFITRHQVQEAAVHHWDAVASIGQPWAIAPAVAADCVDEFLTFSVTTDAWPIDEKLEPLDATFSLVCNDLGVAWVVTDGTTARTVSASRGRVEPSLSASAAELLLWLYNRSEVDESAVGEPASRLRKLTYTD